MKNIVRKFVERCIKTHMAAFEDWPHGKPVESWIDENGDLCIRYESHNRWHYKETEDGNIEWW